MKKYIRYILGSVITLLTVGIAHEFIGDFYHHFFKQNTNIVMLEIKEKLDDGVEKGDIINKIKDMIISKEENQVDKSNIEAIFNQIIKSERDFYRLLSSKYLSCLTILDYNDDSNVNNIRKCGLVYQSIEKDFDKCYPNSKILYRKNKESQKKSEYDCKAMLLLKIKENDDKKKGH